MPESKRPFIATHLAIPLNLEPNLEYELLLRFESEQLLEIKLYVNSLPNFWENNTLQNRLSAMFIGALLILVLYNAILVVGMGQLYFLWYTLFLLSILINTGLLGGDLYHVFFKETPQQLHWVMSLSRMVLMVSLTKFIQSFSLSKTRCPKLHFALNLVLWVLFLIFILHYFLTFSQIQLLVGVIALLLLFLTLTTVVTIFLQGHREAKFIVLGTSLYTILNLLVTPRLFGLIPHPEFGLGLGKSLVLLDIGLFGMALSDKLRVIQKERRLAQEKLLIQAKEHTEHLEAKVEHRTKELKENQEELQKANQVKNQFFSILAHDLRGPIGSIASMLRSVDKGEFELSKNLVSSSAQSMARVYGLLENLLTWAQSQQSVLKPEPTTLSMTKIMALTAELVDEQAKHKGVEIIIESPMDLYVFADEMMLQTTIRNLLSNSLKFTPRGKRVYLRASSTGNKVLLEVVDEGVGMKPEVLEKLFILGENKISHLGTENEIGSGFGLMLVLELVEKNGGKIEVESEFGKGSTFRVTLPREQGES